MVQFYLTHSQLLSFSLAQREASSTKAVEGVYKGKGNLSKIQRERQKYGTHLPPIWIILIEYLQDITLFKS